MPASPRDATEKGRPSNSEPLKSDARCSISLVVRGVLGLAVLVVTGLCVAYEDTLDHHVLFRLYFHVFMWIINMIFVFSLHFYHPNFVRLCLIILNVMYIPAVSAALAELRKFTVMSRTTPSPWSLLMVQSAVMWSFIAGVPIFQLLVLRSIQKVALSDILWWQGVRAGAERSPMAKRFGSIYLRYQIRIDARLVSVTGERRLPHLPRLQGLTWTTLPFYYEVVNTIKKMIVVVVCAYLGGPNSGVLLQVLLGLILVAFEELAVVLKPYVVRDLDDLDDQQQSPHRVRLFLLRSATLVDCNQIERIGTFCLLIFLGSASVFHDRDCDVNHADAICRTFDVVGLLIFLGGIAYCMVNPLALAYLQLRNRGRPMTSFFLSHYQATGNDACKLLAMAIENEGQSA